MLGNYFKLAFRNLNKYKVLSLIKIIGLSIGLTVLIAIFSWVNNEVSYDKFHEGADRIYRLVMYDNYVMAPPGFKEVLDKTSGIEYSVRLFKASFLGERTKISYKDKVFTNDELYYADSDFFNVFSFPLIQGDIATALQNPHAAVITESTAKKYFPNTDPIGKMLTIGDNDKVEVTGILKDIPGNSHFHFDILANLEGHAWNINFSTFGSAWVFPTYVKIAENANIKSIEQNISETLCSFPEPPDIKYNFQPITDIHLHSHKTGELEANSDIRYVYIFSAVGFLILLIAAINYINLTTASSFKRMKEISIKKVIGASRKHLLFQFVSESLIISMIAFVFALVILELIKPFIISQLNTSFFQNTSNEMIILSVVFLFTILMGFVTGFIPGITLSNFTIISLQKSYSVPCSKKGFTSRVLVIFQFCISIVLITCSLVIYNQMQYIQNKKLGYDKDQILVIHTGYKEIEKKIDVLKDEIIQNPNIYDVSSCSQLPANIITAEGINTEDGTRYESCYISADKDFFQTLGISILKGKDEIKNLNIRSDISVKDYSNKFVVNKALLDKIGIDISNAQNTSLLIRHGNMQYGSIIGVVDNFHFSSLHEPIRPLVIEFTPWNNKEYLLIKVNTQDLSKTISFIRNKWKSISSDLPFEYSFLNQEYNNLYHSEMQTGLLLVTFTIISIVIIMLGLLGLISFTTAQRTKEIGIRKTVGATSLNILTLLLKRFLVWTAIATAIAWPIAFYFMHNWLENFAFRIHLTPLPFLISGFIALFIALATIIWHALKAAHTNPAKVMKYE